MQIELEPKELRRLQSLVDERLSEMRGKPQLWNPESIVATRVLLDKLKREPAVPSGGPREAHHQWP